MSDTPTILVAEDDPKTRELLEIILISANYKVVTVQDGREALEYLQQNTPDLAILDIDMPFMKGTDVANRMRRVTRIAHVPLIILTASRDDRSQVDAAFSKVDVFMTKPFRSRELLDAVAALLPERPAPQPAQGKVTPPVEPDKRRILVVADGQTVRKFVIDVLEGRGHKVMSAETAADASSLVRDYLGALSLVILDLDLPGGASFALLQEIRQRSSLPVILLTDRQQEASIKRDYQEESLQKPFNPKELLLKVEQLLRS
jgi:DNA-binding response OmpR family regulator